MNSHTKVIFLFFLDNLVRVLNFLALLEVIFKNKIIPPTVAPTIFLG